VTTASQKILVTKPIRRPPHAIIRYSCPFAVHLGPNPQVRNGGELLLDQIHSEFRAECFYDCIAGVSAFEAIWWTVARSLRTLRVTPLSVLNRR
jgi:hypothetical protein